MPSRINGINLAELVTQGRQLEAATHSAKRILDDKPAEHPNSRVKKPGRYSRKSVNPKYLSNNNEKNTKCPNCSSKACKGNHKCLAYNLECFDCHKQGHFRGAKSCKKPKYKQRTRRVESDDSTETESSSSDSEDLPTSSDSDRCPPINRIKSKKLHRHLSKIQRIQTKKIRKISKKPRYQVNITIKEQIIPAFADTGADINIMSLKNAKLLHLPLKKCKTKIRPYVSIPIKCSGYYDGTIIHGSTVANIRFYVVRRELETLLSGRASEALGIIKFDPQDQPNISITQYRQ